MKWRLALVVTLALAGCNGKPDDESINEANVTNVPEEVPSETVPFNASPVPSNAGAVENRASPPPISDEQQIQDDADATGMTSRLPDETEMPLPASDNAAKNRARADHDTGNVTAPN
jgi:hypothetical protein